MPLPPHPVRPILCGLGFCRYDTDGSITVPTAAFPRS